MSRDRLLFRPPAFYEKHEIDCLLGVRVSSIDRAKHRLELESGVVLDYDALALCTGARVRKLALPGASFKGVHYLRGIDDADVLKHELGSAVQLCIIGGGFIGLEVASVARGMGKAVTIIEQQPNLMPRAVSPILSQFYRRLHEEHGVRVRTSAGVTEILGSDGRVSGVGLSDGTEIPTQLVVAGIGVIPNTELAAGAGLACSNGVVVDEFASTSDPDIVAAGDCTSHPNAFLGRYLRLESVHNALEQAKTAAGTLLGKPLAYRQYPWFWSDQYDCKLQIVGLSEGFDDIVQRGDTLTRKFSLFYMRNGKLIAVDSVNSAADHMASRQLLASGITPSPTQLADPGLPLKTLL
jgi:3-phenylpropionate/trans-cinnamate dioxygenase ferredoxin reductase subunit